MFRPPRQPFPMIPLDPVSSGFLLLWAFALLEQHLAVELLTPSAHFFDNLFRPFLTQTLLEPNIPPNASISEMINLLLPYIADLIVRGMQYR